MRCLGLSRLILAGIGVLVIGTATADPITLTAPARTAKNGTLYNLDVSFSRAGSGTFEDARRFVVDTGSIGIIANFGWVVGADQKRDAQTCDVGGYTSSNNSYLGQIVEQDVRVKSRSGKGAVTATNIPVLAAFYRCQSSIPPGLHKQSCETMSKQYKKCAPVGDGAPRYMGIGFARHEAVSREFDRHVNVGNPLLNAEELGKDARPRSYMMHTVFQDGRRLLKIEVGADQDDVDGFVKRNGYRAPIVFPLIPKGPDQDFQQPRIGYRVVSKDGKQVDLDTLAQKVNGDGTVPFLPDTGLNEIIMSFPQTTPPCRDANKSYGKSTPICPLTVDPATECRQGNDKTRGRSLMDGARVELVASEAALNDDRDGRAVYHGLTVQTGKVGDACARYSVPAKEARADEPDNYVLNSGRSIMKDCLWYVNADDNGGTNGTGFAALSCK